MTTGMRDKLYSRMEQQFRDRIHRDQQFVLRELQPGDILAVYRRRIDHWLGNAFLDIRAPLENPLFRYLPFGPEEVVKTCAHRPLRQGLEALDERFRQYLDEKVTLTDAKFEYQVSRNEIRRDEENSKYTDKHLDTLTELLNRMGGFFGGAYGLTFAGLVPCETTDGLPALRLEFQDPYHQGEWVRVFIARLPFRYAAKVDGCISLIKRLATERNFLWMLRAERVDKDAWEAQKPEQIRARVLDHGAETTFRTMLRLQDKQERFGQKDWQKAEQFLLQEFKLTYLGEMFQEVAEALGIDPPAYPVEADSPEGRESTLAETRIP
jgi:hypothetical protein